MSAIKSVYCVTPAGVGGMAVGDCDGVVEIRREAVYVQGDPFDHWNGYDKDGNLLRSINCRCPCDIAYDSTAARKEAGK